MLFDSFQRKIEYLRLSVTDLCNIRCHYCMPLEWGGATRQKILTFEEIVRMVRILSELGVRRVRLTGGEPLVRKNLPDLVRQLKTLPKIREVLLTTNAVLLKSMAEPLRDAGLEKINIHLDTLSPEKFRAITRLGNIRHVFEGIEEAHRVGFTPIKLNAVIQKGINDDEVEDLLKFCANHGLILRLIEMMPIGPGRDLMPALYRPLDEILSRLREKYTMYLSGVRMGKGPAVYYKVNQLKTLIGFISSVSQPFCRNCNRIRISSDGRFQDCLAYDGTFSFRDLLRDLDVTDDRIAEEVARLLQGKRESHNNFTQSLEERTPCMMGIGG